MKYLRYLLYLIITSVAFYYVSMSIAQDKSLAGIIIGLIIMFLIVFPMMYLEFISNKKAVEVYCQNCHHFFVPGIEVNQL